MPGNSDLHPILRKIHETAGDILKKLEQVKGELRKTREAIKKGVDVIQEAIHDSIQAQAELQVMEHVADVEAIEPQIAAEEDRVRTERAELDERLEQIGERYERRHEELDETAAERVRNLGSHIFEIDEGEFEAATEGPFTDHVTSAWAPLWEHNEQIERDRCETVEETTEEAVQSIQEFIDQQRELVEQIEAKHVENMPVSDSTSIQIPYYVVVFEVDGRTERHLVVPSNVEAGDGAAAIELSPMTGLEDIITQTELADTTRQRYQAAELIDSAKQYRNDAPPLLSYGDAVERALDDEVELVIDGGES